MWCEWSKFRLDYRSAGSTSNNAERVLKMQSDQACRSAKLVGKYGVTIVCRSGNASTQCKSASAFAVDAMIVDNWYKSAIADDNKLAASAANIEFDGSKVEVKELDYWIVDTFEHVPKAVMGLPIDVVSDSDGETGPQMDFVSSDFIEAELRQDSDCDSDWNTRWKLEATRDVQRSDDVVVETIVSDGVELPTTGSIWEDRHTSSVSCTMSMFLFCEEVMPPGLHDNQSCVRQLSVSCVTCCDIVLLLLWKARYQSTVKKKGVQLWNSEIIAKKKSKMENSGDRWSYCHRGIKLWNEYEPAFSVIYGNNQSALCVRSTKESNTMILALIAGVCWILSNQYLRRRRTKLRNGAIAGSLAMIDRHFRVGMLLSQVKRYWYVGVSSKRKNKCGDGGKSHSEQFGRHRWRERRRGAAMRFATRVGSLLVEL